ncbi:MAG: BON domain-containing protein [Candidatus Promineifilaceae bacterium]|nr:BON domain-containing protein [Candidatus Promineifilaceae bacterium]
MRLDEQIKKDLVNQLYWDSRIDAADVTVRVDDGEVTLSGTVPSYHARQAGADNAWLVEGITAVDNQLEIVYTEPLTLPNDNQIQTRILNSFSWNTDLRDHDLEVNVVNGRATLEGTVDAFWKKLVAESEAYSTRGVIHVTNKLAVVPTEDIVDELIAEDVVNALERNLRVSVEDVDVTVSDGRVTLSGTVPSTDARMAAYNAALYTAGVTDVVNTLTVSLPETMPV